MNDFGLTDKNPRFFYPISDFSFLNPLIKSTDLIKKELLDLVASGKESQWLRTFPDYVKSDKDKAWKVFSFLFFNMKLLKNANSCPVTSSLIYNIPQVLSCDFSYMKANTHILPHKGYSRMVLRCHLPLIVPGNNECGIRVGNETVYWKEGELIIFDDSFEHEAWNNTNQDRVVLMFDIPNPLWNYSAYEISKYKIENLEDPFLLSLAKKEDWLTAFQKGVFPIESF